SGSREQFDGAIVSIKRLRDLNVNLPIEFFTESKLDNFPIRYLRDLNIRLKSIQNKFKCKFSNKLHSVLECSFVNVLFIDSDVLFIHDPSPLFFDSSYKKFGNIFWRDLEKNYPDGSFKTDSGVLFINKFRFETNLRKCLQYTEQNYNSELKGDKESFKNSKIPMNHIQKRPNLVGYLNNEIFYGCSMLQYFNNQPFFIHSTLMKFNFEILRQPLWSHVAIIGKIENINYHKSPIYRRFFPSTNNLIKCDDEILNLNGYLNFCEKDSKR
ncbi:MAG: hypothetical protein P8O83_04240, partial [Flavobacteriaceae bacterium]|nr:hypothetical protein [Flavobacteriaceae bacterium]